MKNEFSQLNLHPELVQTVTQMGYQSPTPIQSAVIPLMLSGKDVIGQAQTGTGKTAAFSLPMIHNLKPGKKHVQCLVVTPTRELAIQVADAMHQYGRHLGASVLPVYGGQSYSRQIGHLKKGTNIVVGTPGRILDLVRRGVLNLNSLSTAILDEADEMLSMGFIDDIEAILKNTPTDRQTALFSATLPKEIRHIAGAYMKDPRTVAVGCTQLTVANTQQRYCLIHESDKVAALTRLIECEDITRSLVFTRTRIGTGELVNALSTRGYPAEALNGDLSQESREQVLNRFRNHQIKILVATDVAARGLDIEDISHVVNFDLPQDPEVYVHRIGRTGRAGKPGIAVSLVTPKERWRVQRIESFTKQKLTASALPSMEDIQSSRDLQLMEKMNVWLKRGRCHLEKEIVTKLMEEGHDPVQIAATALKLARSDENKRPVESISEIKVPPGTADPHTEKKSIIKKSGKNGMPIEKGMVRFSLNTGKINNLKVNQVVGSISHCMEIPGHCLGKVRIRKNYTLVDIPKKFVGKVLENIDECRIGRQKIRVARV